MFSLIYESEWLDERLNAVGKLRMFQIATPRKYAMSCARGAWRSPNRRRAEELRDVTNTLGHHAKVDRPTFEQLKLSRSTIVRAAGEMIFGEPTAFGLDGPMGFSQAEVVRRTMGDKELASRLTYQGPRIPRDIVGANPNETVGAPAPPMAPSERRIAGATAPNTDDEQRIRQNYNSHIVCVDAACARGHAFYKNDDTLTAAVKMYIVKRSGFKEK